MTKKQTKKIVKKESKELESKKTYMERITKAYSNPDVFIPERKLLEEFEELNSSSKALTKSQKERKQELSNELGMLYGLENGIWAANLSHSKYYPTLGQMRRNIVKDYDCRTSLELMLADRIVASYWRSMKCDSVFNRFVEKEDGSFSFDQLKVNIIKGLNKGIDLANRQLNASIILLKELKQPSLGVNVKTKTAFIGQNQQFNVDQQNKNKNNEVK